VQPETQVRSVLRDLRARQDPRDRWDSLEDLEGLVTPERQDLWVLSAGLVLWARMV